jgi:hypothetical protein
MLQALFCSPLILSSKVGDRRSPERSVPAQRTGGAAASDDTPAHVGEAEGAVGPAEGGGKTEARGEGCHLGAGVSRCKEDGMAKVSFAEGCQRLMVELAWAVTVRDSRLYNERTNSMRIDSCMFRRTRSS